MSYSQTVSLEWDSHAFSQAQKADTHCFTQPSTSHFNDSTDIEVVRRIESDAVCGIDVDSSSSVTGLDGSIFVAGTTASTRIGPSLRDVQGPTGFASQLVSTAETSVLSSSSRAGTRIEVRNHVSVAYFGRHDTASLSESVSHSSVAVFDTDVFANYESLSLTIATSVHQQLGDRDQPPFGPFLANARVIDHDTGELLYTFDIGESVDGRFYEATTHSIPFESRIGHQVRVEFSGAAETIDAFASGQEWQRVNVTVSVPEPDSRWFLLLSSTLLGFGRPRRSTTRQNEGMRHGSK